MSKKFKVKGHHYLIISAVILIGGFLIYSNSPYAASGKSVSGFCPPNCNSAGLNISNIQSTQLTSSSVVITFTTNQIAGGEVCWGYDKQMKNTAACVHGVDSSGNVIRDTTHAIKLSGFNPSATYYYYVIAFAAGTTQSSTQSFTTLAGPPPDTTPPSVPTLSLQVEPPSQVYLSWSTSTDNVGVVGYKLYRNGVLLVTTTWTFYTDGVLIPNTINTYTVVAYDAAGNMSAPSSPISYSTISTDTTPPTVSVTSPVSNALVNGTVSLTANALDNVAVATVRFFVDGVAIDTASSSPYSVKWYTSVATSTATSTPSNGMHTITAVATDTSKNMTTSAPVTVTVSN